MLSVFNGAPDRYQWELKGKSEAYVPYNAYRLAAPSVKIATLATPYTLNPELLRYELHRVWNVEGKLKPDTRHIYSRRNFHVDEDTWMIVSAELYDGRGELWRVQRPTRSTTTIRTSARKWRPRLRPAEPGLLCRGAEQ